MGRTPDAYDGPRIDEAIIWEEQPSDPAESLKTQFVQGKGLVTLVDGAVRSIGETRDAYWQASVSNFENTPPLTPAPGDRVIVGDTPTGAFVGHAYEIAQWNGTAWVFTAPKNGTAAFVRAGLAPTPYIQTNDSAPWMWEKLNPGGFFGSELHHITDVTLSSTSSTSWQTKLTLTTGALPLGDYFVVAFTVISGTSVGTEVASRLVWDAAERASVLAKPGVADGQVAFTPYDILVNTSGVHSINVDWRKAGGGGAAVIHGARITLWRLA